jgi:flavodoxin I
VKVLIVYDSFFGNTEQVAQAMGNALAAQAEVEVKKVSSVRPEQLTGLAVLIVGSPTRGFRASPATMDLLKAIPAAGLAGVRVAAFDTRIPMANVSNRIIRFMSRWAGYAADPIAKGLTAKGGELAVPAEGFFVKDSEGPLTEGELERAAEWARGIVA